MMKRSAETKGNEAKMKVLNLLQTVSTLALSDMSPEDVTFMTDLSNRIQEYWEHRMTRRLNNSLSGKQFFGAKPVNRSASGEYTPFQMGEVTGGRNIPLSNGQSNAEESSDLEQKLVTGSHDGLAPLHLGETESEPTSSASHRAVVGLFSSSGSRPTGGGKSNALVRRQGEESKSLEVHCVSLQKH